MTQNTIYVVLLYETNRMRLQNRKQYLWNFTLNSFLLIALLFSPGSKSHGQNLAQHPDTSVERLEKIGNHKLFISIRGSRDAKFTVIFESGAGGSSKDWAKVIPMLSQEIRTIAYDRAGIGKSEKGPLPQTMAQNVFELHELLKAANIKGPIILVGQSIGGLLVRLYAEQYGKNVVGLVLVDPTNESSVLGSMKYGGWVRLREKATGIPIPKPQVKDTISAGYDSNADYMAEEFQNIYLSRRKNIQQLGNRPLIILGAGIRKQPPGTPDEQWKKIRDEKDQQAQELTTLSRNSKFILDPKSTHSIHNDNPAIVAESIQMVINAIVSKSKL
jgi:pimeloyl-ACP methyl ester carboxylesterase